MPEKYTVKITPQAQEQLLEIIDYRCDALVGLLSAVVVQGN